MYSAFQLAKKYLHYRCTAANGKGHGMHSPFVFNFIQDVLNNRPGYTLPQNLVQLRHRLRTDKRILPINDLGAGSRTGAGAQRAVAQLARTAVKPARYAQLLYRVVRRYQPACVVELGTSLGVTTACMAAANSAAQVYTVEGSAAIRAVALENFAALGLHNITAIDGEFGDVLPPLLQRIPPVDLAFVDGNHQYGATVSYFLQLAEHAHNDTILVFDDIHWSAGMEQAWAEIKAHPKVRATIDIFFLGFVLFRAEFRERQHFTIRY